MSGYNDVPIAVVAQRCPKGPRFAVMLGSFLRKPPMNTTNQENKELLRKILTGIAQKNFNIQTLESRKMDNLDFHEVAVWQIKDALNDAFLAGMQTGMTL